MSELLRIGVGVALCAAAGSGLLPRARSLRSALAPEALGLAAAAGLAVTAPALLLLGLADVPVHAGTIAAGTLLFAIAFRALRGRASEEPDALGVPRPAVSALVPAAALAVFAAKVAAVPLWSWDHYAVWGMKSRAMLTDGLLDLAFLRAFPYAMANADYPLGLPMVWRVLTLGAEPSALDFRICHVLFGAGVVLAVRRILREAGAPGLWPDAASAFVAVSPLFWDTESLGIAEMPLAWFALTALGLALRSARERGGLALPAGAVLGFLPWVKKEGASLALWIVAAAAVAGAPRRSDRLRRLLPAGLLAAAMAGAAIALERRLLPRGLTSFFAGDWAVRARERLAHPLSVLAPVGREFLSPAWLGFWILAAAAFAIAWRRRRSEALAVFGIVLAQIALYVPVYFATYLEPAAHVRASFFRLLAALLPIGAVGIGLTPASPPEGAEPPGVSAS